MATMKLPGNPIPSTKTERDATSRDAFGRGGATMDVIDADRTLPGRKLGPGIINTLAHKDNGPARPMVRQSGPSRRVRGRR